MASLKSVMFLLGTASGGRVAVAGSFCAERCTDEQATSCRPISVVKMNLDVVFMRYLRGRWIMPVSLNQVSAFLPAAVASLDNVTSNDHGCFPAG